MADAWKVFVTLEAFASRSTWLALHHRLGHRNPESSCRLLRRMKVSTKGMTRVERSFCYSCAASKAQSDPVVRNINSKKIKVVGPTDLHVASHLNLDLSGPHAPSIQGHFLYSLIVTCRSTRWKWIEGLVQKSDTYEALRRILRDAKRMRPDGCGLKLTSDSDPMFGNACSAFQEVLTEFEAEHEKTGPYRQWHNSCAERAIRTISESSRALRHAAGLNHEFWFLSQQYAVHCDRMMPRQVLHWESPQNAVGKPEPKLSWFVPFGVMGAFKTPQTRKDDCRGRLGMVVGVDPRSMYATVLLTKTVTGRLSVIKSHHVTYDSTAPTAMGMGDGDCTEVCIPPQENWATPLDDQSIVPGFVSTNIRIGPTAMRGPVLQTGMTGHVTVPVSQSNDATTSPDDTTLVLDLDAMGYATQQSAHGSTPDTETSMTVPATPTNATHTMRTRSRANMAASALGAAAANVEGTMMLVGNADATELMDVSPLNVNEAQLCSLMQVDPRDHQRVDRIRLNNQMLRLRNQHLVCLIMGKQYPSQTAALKACPEHLKPKVLAAVRNEIDNLVLTGTIKPVSDRAIPRSFRRTPSQMLVKVKQNEALDLAKARWKARLVVMGNRQIPSVHYFSSTAACPKLSTIMMIIATAALRSRPLYSFDVPAAFTKSDAEPSIDLCYISVPKDIEQTGTDGHPIKYQITSSLYGCASAPRQWLLMLAKFMRTQKFTQIEGDVCVWVRNQNTPDFITIGIHVDDAIGYAMKDEVMATFLEAVKARFDADAELVSFFLGLNIRQKLGPGPGCGVHVNQLTHKINVGKMPV